MSDIDVGVVVPTLGTRPDYLELTLKAIRNAGNAYICIVAPSSCDFSDLLRSGAIDAVVIDPGQGLPAAIDLGIRSFPPKILYTTWLGDDDLLEPQSITVVSEALRGSTVQFVWGRCRYINEHGKQIWVNKSGRWALALMRFGPNLVPQPGSMFTRQAYNEVGGLDIKYGWAFDQDLFTKIGRKYSVRYLPQILASFRWHDGSLSAGSRDGSITESSRIRMENLPGLLRPFSSVWEVPVQYAIRKAGLRMNRLSR